MNLRSFLGPCALAKRCHRPLGQFSVIWSPHLDSNQAKSLCRRRPRHSAILTCLTDRLGLEPRTTILEIVMLPITPPTYDKCCDSGNRPQHERLMRPSCPPVHLIAMCGSTFLSKNGNGGWIQTNDPRGQIPMLYQLSYTASIYLKNCITILCYCSSRLESNQHTFFNFGGEYRHRTDLLTSVQAR